MFKQYPYAKYEGLSPIYQGWKTNHLPMLYTIYRVCDVATDLIEEALDSYKTKEDLYELTDVTYPKTELEEDYVAKTNVYLADINHYGIDVVIGRHLATKHDAIPSQMYHGFLRLAYGKRSEDDLLVAQAMAYFDVIATPFALNGTPQSSTSFTESFGALETAYSQLEDKPLSSIAMDRFHELRNIPSLQERLFVDPAIERHPEAWLAFLLDHYMRTSNEQTLHAITAFHSYMMLEELITDSSQVLRQWMLSSELLMLLDDVVTPIVDPTMVEWDIMRQNIHLNGDAHRTTMIFALYELDQRYELPQCRVIASHLYLSA